MVEEFIETNTQKTPEELLKDSYIALDKAKNDLNGITTQDFLKTTLHACMFDEKGNSLSSSLNFY